MRITHAAALLTAGLAAGLSLPACATATHPVSMSLQAAPATRPSAHAAQRGGAAHGRAAAASSGRSVERSTPPGSTPAAGQLLATAALPTRVIGHGTAASCTSAAVVKAVAAGGVITFSCGPKPVTITMRATAKVVNTSRQVVLDGGGTITLSGAGRRRILYMNTCDERQVWTTDHCQDQSTPRLTVRNLTFIDGNATGHDITGGSGGAIYAQGGRLKVVNSRFIGNRCYGSGPDLGGAAIRALMQYQNRPVYVVRSTFTGGVCSNGGALSSIGVSWVVLDSVMTRNKAIGWGANPARPGSPGGGSGGAIYTDGDTYTVTISGSTISRNHAREGGGAIFFVSNDRTGTLRIEHSALRHDPNDGFFTAGYPGIFFLGLGGHPIVTDSVIG